MDGLWEKVTPEELLLARHRAVDRALRRMLGDAVEDASIRDALDLLRPVVDAARALAVGGRACAGPGLRFALGRGTGTASRGELAAAHVALAAAARAAAGAGLACGLLAAALGFALTSRSGGEPSPAELARAIQWMVLAPLAGLAAGRLALGGLADAAALAAGLGRRASPRPGGDLALLAVLVFPVLLLLTLTR